MSSGVWRGLIVSVALSVLGYLAFSLWGGWRDVLAAMARVGWWGVAWMLLLSAVNYGLRFVRWQMYLACQGLRLPWRVNLPIYIAGFALTTTPGKAGEAMRSVFLKPLGVGYGASMAALLSERLSDLIAVVLLAGVGLTRYPAAWPLLLAGAAACGLLLLLLTRAGWLEGLARFGERRGGRIGRVLHKAVPLLLAARRCNAPRIFFPATAISLVAWGAEAAAFCYMLGKLGLQVDNGFAVFVYAASMLAGALSFLPGGLGGAEATMVSLLLWAGQPHAAAVAGTVLIRLTTLWYAVVLGLAALASLLRREAAVARTDGAGLPPGIERQKMPDAVLSRSLGKK